MTLAPHATAGLAMALASATLYGLNIGYARIASFAGLSGTTIVAYRVFLMLALAGLAAVLLRRSLAVPREERATIAVLGLTTTLISICYLSAVAYIPVAVAVVVFYTFPIVIVLASPFVEGTRLTAGLLGVVALALAGVGLVVGPAFEALDWRGLALAATASVATAAQFFAAARSRLTGALPKVFWIHVVVLPLSAAIGLAAGELSAPSALLLAPLAAGITIGAYVVGFALQMVALSRIPAVAAGIVYCAEPVVAALSSTFILGETLSPLQLAGGALVIVAIVLDVTLSARRSAAPVVPAD